MGTQEINVVRDQAPIDHNPIDPNVIVPRHVREAAEAAEAIHKQAYTQPPEVDAPTLQPDAADQITVAVNDPPPAQSVQAPIPPPPQNDFVEAASAHDLKDSVWAQRYNSMRGRWEATSREVGQLQELVSQLGSELRATQQAVAHGQSLPGQVAPAPRSHEKLITDKDRETFGDDLIDVATRAAREAVGPEMDALRDQNEDLKKRVVTTAQGELRASLAMSVPNWVAINRDPRFHGWLRLRNPYTGAVRGVMLNDAYRAANAPQVIATFRDFVNEVRATGGELPGQPQEQRGQQQQDPPPHQAAVALETLAAPGRARPAGGDSQVPADKPFYTRAQISNFYRDVRRQVYVGRDVEKDRIERDIIAAQSEGRVRG